MSEPNFNALYRRLKVKVNNMIKRYITDEDDVKDVAQVVWIKVWMKLDKRDTNAPIEQWVLSVAKNSALNFIRDRKNNLSLSIFEDVEYSNIVLDKEMNREDEIITDELIAQIDEEIDRLPRHQRNPTKLAIKDQLTPDAISLVTGVESRLVKQYIHKGKKRIYKQINGDRVKA